MLAMRRERKKGRVFKFYRTPWFLEAVVGLDLIALEACHNDGMACARPSPRSSTVSGFNLTTPYRKDLEFSVSGSETNKKFNQGSSQ